MEDLEDGKELNCITEHPALDPSAQKTGACSSLVESTTPETSKATRKVAVRKVNADIPPLDSNLLPALLPAEAAFTAEYLAPNILLPVSPISIVPQHAATLGDRQTFSASEKSRAE
ncbi:hypothetical protein P5673_030213 [Acropora cervicornis]|uniref:Uncharacterized protein n=1 Tax=Acropora cervicornis TaxID=6130 RepID=A0AAD9PVF3_ACRCE|nr:hypothetical protein P5673_030213 [Acropora cervicornis]